MPRSRRASLAAGAEADDWIADGAGRSNREASPERPAADADRAPPEGPRGRRRRLAARQRGAHRGGPGHGRRPVGHASGQAVDPAIGRIAVDGRPLAARRPAPVHLLLHKPAGVTSTVRDRHAARTVLDLVPRALVPDGGAALPGRPARPRLGGPAPAHQRRGRGPSGCSIRGSASSASTRSGIRTPLDGQRARALGEGIPLEEGLAALFHLPADDRRPRPHRLAELLAPAAAAARLVPGHAPAGLEAPDPADVRRGRRRRSSGSSGSGSAPSGSRTCAAARCGR